MKKIFLVALAAIGMTACMQDEVMEIANGGAIAFENAFVGNATRAAAVIDNGNLTAFQVWGYVNEPSGVVFNETLVSKNGNAWSYEGTQYWAPDNDYYFAAVAPLSDLWTLNTVSAGVTGPGVLTFTNDAATDLIYAEKYVRSASAGKANPAVALQFQHLLSKVKLTFKNGFPTENVKVAVNNIKMTTPETATIDLGAVHAWGSYGNENLTLDFDVNTLASKASYTTEKEYFIFPTACGIEFDLQVYVGDQQVHTGHKTAALPADSFVMGHAYNLSAEINPSVLDFDEIVFTVDKVEEWIDVEQTVIGAYKDENNSKYYVASAEGLAQVAEEINAGAFNGTVELTGDIDLADFVITRSAATTSNWVPVGTPDTPFTGVFDGNGYTIKNLALVEDEAKEGKAYIGFFGYAEDATIKNVTFENVYINIPCLDIDHSQGHIGAVAGSLEGTSTIENVTVKGDITVYATQNANGASRVAVVAGGNSYGDVTMKNVHVIANEGSSLIANNNTGALAGQLQGKMVFENCSSNIDVTVNKFFAGGLVGIAAGDSKFVDCHTTGDVAVVAGREGRANDHYRVGDIAGGWADGKDKVCTLENCSYTGNVSGKNADGSVAKVLDYAGYVGRGYTLSNCAGSKVIINGTEYVQVGNVAPFGNYTINGLTPVATADELVAALEAEEGVFFMNDIKIEPASMSNAYGTTGINVKHGQTIDGNGYTLNIKGAGGTWDSGINTTGGLIKNLTVTGSFRGIFINHTSEYSEKVVLENVTIGGNGTVYTISCDQGLYQGIEATNCTFNGWTSYAADAGEAKFVNCSFGEGSGYAYCRPYSNTEFVNCTFCPGYAVDTTRATVTFTGCTFEE